ncbi:MAG: hypothetical protein P0120_03880 [Nitrospira sp.]|nr:hypothetical protein [Nitrospira sp.]
MNCDPSGLRAVARDNSRMEQTTRSPSRPAGRVAYEKETVSQLSRTLAGKIQ